MTLTTADRPPEQSAAPASPRRRRSWIAGALLAVLILGVGLPPLINLNRYQRRVAATISGSLGRPVELSGVRLQLLPRPGFYISNFVVDEAPGFGAEPMLQCSGVSASLRLASLWRGRFEVARISFDDPSLNLVRNPQGYWNFASILTQASRASNAPTGGLRPSRELRFPYIEASGARVNFKYGDEKEPFSFLNADVAVWLENPGEWRVRFRAEPVRTDMHVSSEDTGVVRVDGSLRRGPSLDLLPLDLNATWENAPLGQLTRLFTGQDYGWRANTRFAAHLTGAPGDLLFHVAAQAERFHRAEFEPRRSLRLATVCEAEYLRASQLLRSLSCTAPVSPGQLRVSGSVTHLGTDPAPQLAFSIDRAPAAAALELLRHVRDRLPPGAQISGTLDGGFDLTPSGVQGSLTATDVAVRAPGLQTPMLLPRLRFSASSGPTVRGLRSLAELALLLQPAAINLGAETPLTISGRLTADGVALRASGAAALSRLLPLSRAFGLLPSSVQGLAPVGEAQLGLTFAAPWLTQRSAAADETTPAVVTGTVALRRAQLEAPYLRQPLRIDAAQGALGGGAVSWNDIAARFGTIHFGGSLRMPLVCPPAPAVCVRRFDLNAPVLDLAALAAALHGGEPAVVRELVQRVQGAAQWPALEGSLRVAKLTAGSLTLQPAQLDLALEGSVLRVSSLNAQTLGGALQGSGASLGDGRYTANFALSHADAKAVAALFGESWGAGRLDASGALKLSGNSAQELAQSATGTVQWNWTGGAWPQAAGTPFSQFENWTAEGALRDGMVALSRSLVVSGGDAASVTGTISLSRRLDLRIGASGDLPSTAIAGALSNPVTTPPAVAGAAQP